VALPLTIKVSKDSPVPIVHWFEAEWLKVVGAACMALAGWLFRSALKNGRPRNGSKAQLVQDIHDLRVSLATERESRTLMEEEVARLKVRVQTLMQEREMS